MFRFETLISVTLEVSAPSLSPAGLLLCVERPVDRSRCLWAGTCHLCDVSVSGCGQCAVEATASRRVACLKALTLFNKT